MLDTLAAYILLCLMLSPVLLALATLLGRGGVAAALIGLAVWRIAEFAPLRQAMSDYSGIVIAVAFGVLFGGVLLLKRLHNMRVEIDRYLDKQAIDKRYDARRM